MRKTLNIGMIGLDTSHVPAFTRLLNDPADAHHVAGGKVLAAYPGGSPDVEQSISRVEGFTATLRDEFGVALYDSPEAVAEASDLVFIETIDGRIHKALFEKVAPYGKPVFIDKPLTVDPGEAEAILDLADRSKIPVMSCSALRYADNFRAALGNAGEGEIAGCDAFGPMHFLPPFEGLYWYGIHTVEMLVAALGVGCRSVRVSGTRDHELVACEWGDGRMASIHGLRHLHGQFGITLHRRQGMRFVDISRNERPNYAGLLEAVLRSLPQGRSEIPRDEMLEVVRIIDAANTSRRSNGAVVELT